MTTKREPDASSRPGLRRVIDTAIEEALSSMMLRPEPAVVLSFDREKSIVVVQPLVMRVVYGEENVRSLRKKPVFEDVPVLFFGAGAKRTTVPLESGNVGLLIPCDASLSVWLLKGGFVDPGDAAAGRSDVVFLPGLHDLRGVPDDGTDSSSTVVNGPVKLGGATGTQKTIKASSWQSAHTTLIQAIATAVGGGGGTAINTALGVFNGKDWKTDDTEVK